jgi:Leucine-rich repeat (LRR) protein
MGTPDFIAPEQARDSHTADIRSDLYSLGCTLYYLLTGQVPFPGGSLTEKLLKHQMDAARPLRGLRPEVPPAVAAVLDRLMAKRPEQRYQSPAEVAAALTAAQASGGVAVGEQAKAPQRVEAADSPFAGLRSDSVAGPAGEAMAQRSRRRLLLVGVAVGGVALALLGLVIWRMSKGDLKGRGADQAKERPATQPGPKERPPHPKQVAAELRKLGAKIKTVRNQPDNPVTGIDLVKTAVTDAGLAQLKVFPSLEALDLSDTQVSDAGMPSLEGLSMLRVLRLGNTRVGDAGLASLKGLTRLEVLKLNGTRIRDGGLAHLSGLAGLRDLTLSQTKVSSAGLVHLEALGELRALDLNDTRIDDAGLLRLAACPNLQDLHVAGTSVTDAGLPHLVALRNLERLDLSGTAVTDAGVPHLKGLPRLWSLALSRARVSDAGLADLKGLPQLLQLHLWATNVTDAGLVHLGGLKKLNFLVLSGTQVTDKGLVHLEGSTRLEKLNLAGTRVTDAGAQRLRKALPKLTIIR